jgi:N-sulfoglucosamine sulfohydrolase
MKNHLHYWALAVLWALASTVVVNAQTHNTKPNIVLIVSDDHGTADLGCYGNEAIHTPNLDNLAAEGVKFTRAYATSASCSPSRSVLLTGLFSHANGQYSLRHGVHGHVYTLPDMLREKGKYYTARIGKFHIGNKEVFGFDKVYGTRNNRNGVAMADSVRNLIENADQRPFFLYFCSADPHRGMGWVEDHPLKPDRFGNREKGFEANKPVHFKESEIEVPSYLPDNPAVRAELAQYYESVARLDYGIGHLFEIIKSAGIWDNTVIIYVSDNGIAFPGAKTNTYEAALKLPCIVKPSKRIKPAISDALVSWVDITPTILDFAGVLDATNDEITEGWRINHDPYKTTQRGLQGRSFKDIVYQNTDQNRDTVFAAHNGHEETMYYPMRVMITRKYKLIWNLAHQLPYPHSGDLWNSSTWQYALQKKEYRGQPIADYTQRPEFELYDLENDPWEQNNLAYDEKYLDIRQQYLQRIKTMQQETNDPWLVKWVHE